MRHGFRKVAAVSPRIRLGDVDYNVGAVAEAAAQAAAAGSRIVVFPARALTGATAGDLSAHATVRQSAQQGLDRLLAATARLDALIFLGGSLALDGIDVEGVYAISRGEILGFVPGSPAAAAAASRGGRQFAVGGDLVFVDEEDETVRLAARFDDANPDGAGAVVRCVAEPEFVGSSVRRAAAARAASAVSGYILAAAGAGESTTDYLYAGQRLIAEAGEILAESVFLSEGTTLSELDFGAVDYLRRRAGIAARGREVRFRSGARTDVALTRAYARLPFVGDEADRARLLRMQAAALAARVAFTRAARLVVGVSGGLDSALALFAACRAMDELGRPRTDVLAVTMPCFGTTGRTLANAARLMRALGVSDRKISVKKSVLAHFRDIGHDPAVVDVAYENAQARERTQVLMDLANEVGGLVVGTGDLSELALGWATFNGDHMSMYGVNASLPKTLVRALVGTVRDAAAAAGDGLLARTLGDILATPVSPELLPAVGSEPAQQTEETVGPYELHDFFLWHFLARGASPDKILRLAEYAFAGKYASAVIAAWLETFFRRFFSAQFKRNCMPDGADLTGLGLSPRAFRMPSDMSAADWLARLR